LKGLGSEKGFEMTIVEFLDFKFNLACIHRSPDGDFYKCLDKLETVICKVQSKGKQLILCGNWNIDFSQDRAQLQGLQN
jgi:hypothetical protein